MIINSNGLLPFCHNPSLRVDELYSAKYPILVYSYIFDLFLGISAFFYISPRHPLPCWNIQPFPFFVLRIIKRGTSTVNNVWELFSSHFSCGNCDLSLFGELLGQPTVKDSRDLFSVFLGTYLLVTQKTGTGNCEYTESNFPSTFQGKDSV